MYICIHLYLYIYFCIRFLTNVFLILVNGRLFECFIVTFISHAVEYSYPLRLKTVQIILYMCYLRKSFFI